jgi:hypothetical protein
MNDEEVGGFSLNFLKKSVETALRVQIEVDQTDLQNAHQYQMSGSIRIP